MFPEKLRAYLISEGSARHRITLRNNQGQDIFDIEISDVINILKEQNNDNVMHRAILQVDDRISKANDQINYLENRLSSLEQQTRIKRLSRLAYSTAKRFLNQIADSWFIDDFKYFELVSIAPDRNEIDDFLSIQSNDEDAIIHVCIAIDEKAINDAKIVYFKKNNFIEYYNIEDINIFYNLKKIDSDVAKTISNQINTLCNLVKSSISTELKF